MIVFACRRGSNVVLRRLCLAAVIGCAVAVTAWAQAPGNVRDYALPAASLAQSINAIGQSNDVQVIYDAALLKGKMAAPISGHFTLSQALDKALAGSGLTYELVNSGHTVVIRKAPLPSQKSSPTALNNRATKAKEKSVEPTLLSAVAVTGTRIPGGATASPTITITAQQIQDEGFTDLGEVVRSIPQNFNGGQNPGVSLGAAQGSPSNQDITGGSGANLRGLGPDATLTLLNGHRMSYGGYAQAVDISAIPVAAVDRIEIVPDGASAIYGSDAVGGVVNVILKRDFNGVTVGARYGGATEGGLTTHEYNATAGTTWATGGLIVAGEKNSNDPIYSDQRSYTRSMYQPSTLWQGSKLRSGLFSLHQLMGDAVELHLDALGNDRNSHTALAYPDVYYPYNVETKTTMLAPSLEIWLPGDWTLTLSGAFGKEKNSAPQLTVNRADGAVTGSGLVEYRNKSLTYEIGAEGPLFTLPGGEARLATGAGYRYNDLVYLSGNADSFDGDESSRFAYAELDLPLVGPDQGIGGITRLELTGAIRTEDGDYGRVTTPKLGVIYSPSADYTLKASWGKSFKAPTLTQRYTPQLDIYYPASTFGSGYPPDATALWLYGGSANLRPERARTWSASLVFHPEALSNLNTELTWFDIDYTQRVLQPITTYNVFGNPIYADFVYYDPAEAVLAEAVANAGSNFYNYVGAPYDASKVVAIVDGRYVNAARQRIKGVDLSGSYWFDLGVGRLTVRGSASWLDSTQALTAAQSPYQLAGTLYNPARITSRIGAVWQQGGFTASLFGNYTGAVVNTTGGVTNPAYGKKGASFTTFDATLRYDTGARNDGWSNLALELSVHNLLDRAPPLFVPVSWTFTPYDPANYSAVGRFLSLSVSKHF